MDGSLCRQKAQTANDKGRVQEVRLPCVSAQEHTCVAVTTQSVRARIHIRRSNQTFEGVHEPLISKQLFDRVQAVLTGKLNTRTMRHDFLYRRRLTCKNCEYSLIGETQKGYIYYRCQRAECPTTSVGKRRWKRLYFTNFRFCVLARMNAATSGRSSPQCGRNQESTRRT